MSNRVNGVQENQQERPTKTWRSLEVLPTDRPGDAGQREADSMSDFHGLPVRTLSSGHVRLEYLAFAGPRVVRLFLNGSQENLLAELPGVGWETPYGKYLLYGGHRLWHAPESKDQTSVPDNDGLVVEELVDGVRLTRPAEPVTGIAKTIEVRLHADRPALTLHHSMQNCGLWPVELAPWAITQFPLGGVAVLPQASGPLDEAGLLPNRSLVLWPYSRWDDPRLSLGEKQLLVGGQPLPTPFKVGYFSRRGWCGYLRNGVFFCKRFEPQPDQQHPDFGCNVEVYTNHLFLELETLAPLRRLDPGQVTRHTEVWEIYQGVTVEDLESLDLG